MIVTVNPATGESIKSYPVLQSDQVLGVIERGHHGFLQWRTLSPEDRAARIGRLAQGLEWHKDEGARLITTEMGKPLAQSVAEIEKCAWLCRFSAESAAALLVDRPLPSEKGQALVTFQPQGLIFGIMPWNFPFWQVFRFAVPTLIAGNGVLLKHAPNTTGCSLFIEDLFKEAGFLDHEYQSLVMDVELTESILADPHVRGVSLTGSPRAGSSVAALAGRYLKKSVLELGGADAYVVLDDADIDKTVASCAEGRMLNAGQSCISPKRWIVTRKNRAEFEKKMLARLETVPWGDPTDEMNAVGPLARQDLRDHLHDQVKRSLSQGAKLLLGGEVPERDGFYYPPTLLTDVRPGQVAFEEELFGPVGVIIEAADEQEALQMANESSYGLGGGVFTENRTRGLELAKTQIDSGLCFVNSFVRSDPRWPFGGVKNSGYGRELSDFGIHEFVNIKTIAVF